MIRSKRWCVYYNLKSDNKIFHILLYYCLKTPPSFCYLRGQKNRISKALTATILLSYNDKPLLLEILCEGIWYFWRDGKCNSEWLGPYSIIKFVSDTSFIANDDRGNSSANLEFHFNNWTSLLLHSDYDSCHRFLGLNMHDVTLHLTNL